MRLYNRYKMNQLSNCCKNLINRYCTQNSTTVAEKLTQRSLLEVTGKDATTLLQGLVTNDINHLSEIGIGCVYAMFLNTKGRVLYDSIIYKIPETDSFFIEIDKTVATTVQKHLNIYRLRRDITIGNIDDKYQIWAHFNPDIIQKTPKEMDSVKGIDSSTIKQSNSGKILEFGDPRVACLGSRIISTIGNDQTIYNRYGKTATPKYKLIRYHLGIGEGVDELPVGNCFPLEANCDYLNGVSFEKGCYLGQELTARSYHTGVIRKRYMPLYFDSIVDKELQKDEIVKVGDKNVGKLRGIHENVGLGLLRIAQVLDSKKLTISNLSAYTTRPFWWPSEKQKESSVVQ